MPPKKSPAASIPTAPTSPTTGQPPTGAAAVDTSTLSSNTHPEPKSPTTVLKRGKAQSDDIGIEDLLLPRSLTSRLARGVLPPNTSLQKDAILALTKSATVFISYLASTANELTTRKTIQPADVLKALKEMELEKVMGLGMVGSDGRQGGRVERELELFEEGVRGKRRGYREKVKQRESGIGEIEREDGEGEDGGPRKRVRRDSETGNGEEDDEESMLNKQLSGGDVREGMEGVEGQGREGDETEDDPDVPDEDDEDVDEDEEQGDENADEDKVDVDVEESPQKRNRFVLAPDGRAEVGSEDESD